MNEDIKARLSALIDGEADSGETAAVVAAIARDPAVRATAERYFLIGEASRSRAPLATYAGLGDRVSAALETEPVLLRARPGKPRSGGPLAGLALAATVAAVAVLAGVQLWPEPGPGRNVPLASGPPPVTVTTRAPDATPAATPAETAATTAPVSQRQWNVTEPAVEDRLRDYLVNHSEYIGRGVQGMHPYARVVAYDASR